MRITVSGLVLSSGSVGTWCPNNTFLASSVADTLTEMQNHQFDMPVSHETSFDISACHKCGESSTQANTDGVNLCVTVLEDV